MDLAIAVIIQDNASAGLKKISSTSDQAMNDVAKGAEKAGGAFEKFGKKASELAAKMDGQKSKLAILKDKYADLYLTMGAGAPETQKVAEQITELSGNLDTNQKALQEAQAAADSFDATMHDIPGTMDQAGQSSQQFGSVLDDLIPKFTKAQLIKQAATAILDFGKQSIESAASAESAFAKVQTLLSSGTDMAAYFGDIKQASLETGVSIENYAEAVYSAISASVDQADAVDFTTQAIKLAKGGFTDAATAVDVLTTAINAYGLQATDATSIADKLITTQNLGKTTVGELAQAMGRVIPTANSFGVNLDTLAASYAVMTKNGIATAESTTYLNGMLNELGKSGSVAANALKKNTGKSFKELMTSGKSLSDVLNILQDEAKKTGVSISDMFSSQEAGKAANTLIAHSDDLAQSMEAMANSAGATEAAYTTMADTVTERLQRLNNHFAVLKESFGEDLSPGFNSLLSALEKLLPVIDAVAGAVVGTLGTAFSAVGGIADAFATGVQNVIEPSREAKAAIAAQTTTMEDAYNAMVKYAKEYGDAKNQLKDSKKTYAETGEAIGNTTAIIEQARVKYEAARDAYQQFADAQSQAAEEAQQPANKFQAATDTYIASAQELMQTYQETYEQTLSNVQEWFGPFDKAATSVKTNLSEITQNMQSQIDYNNQYAENLQYLADNGLGSLSESLQAYGKDGAAYASAIAQALQEAGGATTEQGQAIIEQFAQLTTGIAESQSSVAKNFANMRTNVDEQIAAMSDTYATAIANLDKTSEARDAANNTISGFIGGLNSSIPGVLSTMSSLGAQMTSALQASVGTITIPATVVVTGRGGGGGRAIGMDYVPYNGMPAILHRGEAILTNHEADQWRRGRSGRNSQGITIVQNIQSVPQTAVQFASATQSYFEQARWAFSGV